MSTGAITPYRSGQRPGRDNFPQLLRAEWTKFRTVRGWVIAMVAAALLTAVAVVALAGASNGTQNAGAHPTVATGPGGEAITDDFYFVGQPLDGNGSITVRVTSLRTELAQAGPGGSAPRIAVPWAKAGIIIKASTKPGSDYAAVMVTAGHGVRMQYDYTHDTAGLRGTVSAASPRWLRLTRSRDTVTRYDSADGKHWAKIGTVSLAGLPSTVQAGFFATSPPVLGGTTLTCPRGVCSPGSIGQTFASNASLASYPTQATAAFDHVSLQGARASGAWRGGQIGFPTGIPFHCTHMPGHSCPRTTPDGFTEAGGTFTVAGSGDIAPYQAGVDPLGTVLKGSLVGLLAVIALGALFITAEYRRGLIRTTFSASPHRSRVLAAKAIVIGS